jgi:hypothetical protein
VSKLVKPIKVKLDKERNLLLDMNAMSDFEDLTGKSFLKGFDLNNLKIKDVRALLWAGLHQEDKTLTPEAVGAMLGVSNIKDVMQAIYKAIASAVPETDDETKNLTQSPSPGDSSGQSGNTLSS